MSRRKPDIEKMKNVLGHPLTALEEGIEQVIGHGKKYHHW